MEPAETTGRVTHSRVTSYDDHQRNAVLVRCAHCQKERYMTVWWPVCAACREENRKVAKASGWLATMEESE